MVALIERSLETQLALVLQRHNRILISCASRKTNLRMGTSDAPLNSLSGPGCGLQAYQWASGAAKGFPVRGFWLAQPGAQAAQAHAWFWVEAVSLARTLLECPCSGISVGSTTGDAGDGFLPRRLILFARWRAGCPGTPVSPGSGWFRTPLKTNGCAPRQVRRVEWKVGAGEDRGECGSTGA